MFADIIEFVRHYVLTLSALGRFGLTLVMLVCIPRLCRRAHVPTAVGLLLSGVIVGPYVLGFFGANRPIADFLAELGKLLLMFFAAWKSISLYSAAPANARSPSVSSLLSYRCCSAPPSVSPSATRPSPRS